MTNEETQEVMDFIVEQQAHFEVKFQRLQEQQRRDAPRLKLLEDSFQLLVKLAEKYR